MNTLRQQASAAGYALHFCNSVPLGKDAHSSRGRRTAVLTPPSCKDISCTKDPHVILLLESGRWVERLVPLQNGQELIVASFYGIAGASADVSDFDANERLIAAVLIRMRQMKGIPYFLGADLNIDPKKSAVPQAEILKGNVFDVVYDRFNGAPPPTFFRHNWADHANDDSTSGKTRIDTFVVNASAAHVNHDVQYCYLEAAAFDHIPIAISS